MTEERFWKKAKCMTVGELRRALEWLPDSLVVRVELTSRDRDKFEGSDLHLAMVESRRDGVEALYLWGDQDCKVSRRPVLELLSGGKRK
jgi:hypothetical protein